MTLSYLRPFPHDGQVPGQSWPGLGLGERPSQWHPGPCGEHLRSEQPTCTAAAGCLRDSTAPPLLSFTAHLMTCTAGGVLSSASSVQKPRPLPGKQKQGCSCRAAEPPVWATGVAACRQHDQLHSCPARRHSAHSCQPASPAMHKDSNPTLRVNVTEAR